MHRDSQSQALHEEDKPDPASTEVYADKIQTINMSDNPYPPLCNNLKRG